MRRRGGRALRRLVPGIDAPIKARTVLDTSGHRPLFEQPDDFLDYLTDVVVPSRAQLPRS